MLDQLSDWLIGFQFFLCLKPLGCLKPDFHEKNIFFFPGPPLPCLPRGLEHYLMRTSLLELKRRKNMKKQTTHLLLSIDEKSWHTPERPPVPVRREDGWTEMNRVYKQIRKFCCYLLLRSHLIIRAAYNTQIAPVVNEWGFNHRNNMKQQETYSRWLHDT